MEDLATARVVVSTAGHQLASEALHLGKVLFVCPEDSAEQRLNARELERIGAARRLDARRAFHPVLSRLLDSAALRRAACPLGLCTGNAPALEVLEAQLRSLAGGGPGGRAPLAAGAAGAALG